MQIGDGPAAVTGDNRRRHVTDLWLGRRGGRRNRESEYLPETEQPPPADQGDGADTWINQGIPGSFSWSGDFFCLSEGQHTRIKAAGNVRR